MLAGVERGDVEIDETDARVLERGARRGGEVAVSRADADDDIGLGGQRVSGRGSGGADPADGRWVIPGQRALAGLGVGDRDAGGLVAAR